MTCSFPQVFWGWGMSCSDVEAASGQGGSSTFHLQGLLDLLLPLGVCQPISNRTL